MRTADDIHKFSDVDNNDRAQHHTLGFERYQAMPGDALKGVVLTDLASVIAALVTLGAVDASP